MRKLFWRGPENRKLIFPRKQLYRSAGFLRKETFVAFPELSLR